MANTTNGIYYPDEYNAPADVPKDMKELAESVDVVIKKIETEQNTKINNLATKNAQQDAQMENLNAKDISLEAEIQTLQSQNTQQTTEIELLKSENTILKNQIPSATVVGKTIHIEDSSNMPCQITPLGASKQETREGYNYLDVANLIAQGCTITWENDILTISSNDVAYANGYIDITHLFKNNSGKQLYFDYEAISATITGASSLVQLIIGYNDGTSTSYQELVRADYGKRPYTIPADTSNIKSCRVCIYSNNYAELNGEQTTTITKPILQFETETKEYEQYGASPSVEHEAPIESVGDNINYLPYPFKDTTKTENGVTFTDNGDGTINIQGTATAETYFYFYSGNIANFGSISEINKKSIMLKELSGIISDSTIMLSLYNLDNSGKSIYLNKGTISNSVIVNNQSQNINITIIVKKGATINTTLKPMIVLEKASTGAYSPYGQGSIGIVNSTENFFDISKLSSNSKNGVTLTKNDNGIIILNGTASDDANFDFYITDIKATTNHKLQLFNLGGSYTNTYVSLYMATDKTWNDFDMLALTTNKITVMPLKEKTYTYARIKVNKGVVCNNLVIGCQVINDVDGTATEYVEGKSQTKVLYTQQPFRAIGDVKDRFVKQNGVWYEEHKINHLVFNGTENWKIDTTKEITQVYKYYNPSLFPQKAVTILSNYFINKVAGDNEGITVGYGQIYIAVNKTTASTIDDFKAKLTELYNAGKPVYVDYVLETPELIECTPEQVEQLESFNTYKNVTNISSDSIGEIEVFYYKDLETLNKNNEERILALENAVLGGN